MDDEFDFLGIGPIVESPEYDFLGVDATDGPPAPAEHVVTHITYTLYTHNIRTHIGCNMICCHIHIMHINMYMLNSQQHR